MEAQQGLGVTREDRQRVHEQAARGSEDRPVRWPEPHTCVEPAFEDGAHLVAEHHDLDVLVRAGLTAGPDQSEHPARGEVDE